MGRFYFPTNAETMDRVLPKLTKIKRIKFYGLYRIFCSCSALTGRVSFPNLTYIESDGLEESFLNCINLKSISFPKLTTIERMGLYFAFAGCTGLTGSVSFPSLTTVSGWGLYNTFRDCTGITEVHFKSSLSGNTQFTASNMGCTNATIYFDLP